MSCEKGFSHSGSGLRVDDKSSECRWVRMSRYKECLLAGNSPSTLQLNHHASWLIFLQPTQLPDCSWEPLVPYPSAEEAFRWSNSHAPTNDFSTLGLSDFFIAHRRVACHRLDCLSLSGNTQELLSWGVGVNLERREPYCHGMTFSDLSFYPFTSSFIVLGLISLLLLTFTLWT